jgi:hypothetical protein
MSGATDIPPMLRRLRENGPVVLVPAIWTVVAGAHLGAVSEHTLLVAHAVMSVLLVAFVTLSWDDMAAPVLRSWRQVILAGIPPAVAGTAGLAATPNVGALLGVAVVGWLVVPAPALVETGRRVDRHPEVYVAGGVASGLGAVVYVAGALGGMGVGVLLAGLALAGAGQTAGIVAAVVDY